jgi:predicted DNA-binding transcriptional regulator YafY
MAKKFSFERYIWFHSQLKRGRYPKLSQLINRFDISPRQAAREIEFMRTFFSAPIEYSRDRDGYFYSNDSFEFPGIWLSQEEIISLVISKRLSTAIPDRRIKRKIDGCLHKISNYTDFDPAQLEKKISLKNIHYYEVEPGIYESCLYAVIHDRKLRIHYQSAHSGEKTERTISPLHLLLYLGNWHLIAHCHTRDELRDFVLSRILEIDILADKVEERTKRDDIKEIIEGHYGIFLQGEERMVSLRFTGKSAAMVRKQVWFPGQKITAQGEDSVVLQFPVSDFRELIGDILRFGAEADVLEPAELRDQIRATIAILSKIYST